MNIYSKLSLYMVWLPLWPTTEWCTVYGFVWFIKNEQDSRFYCTLWQFTLLQEAKPKHERHLIWQNRKHNSKNYLIDWMVFNNTSHTVVRIHGGHVLLVDKATVSVKTFYTYFFGQKIPNRKKRGFIPSRCVIIIILIYSPSKIYI